MWVHPVSMSEVRAMEPLKDTTILVTRPLEQAAQLKNMLEQFGAKVVVFPTIHIVPTTSWDDCDRAIASIGSYDGIIFTSVNAAIYFLNRARLVDEKRFSSFTEKAMYVVGEKTKRAVESFRLKGVVFKGTHDGRTLANALAQQNVRGKRFLFPKGNLGATDIQSTLREHGAIVDEVIVYETLSPSDVDTSTANEMFSRKEIDLIVFFSPSSINNFLSVVPRASLQDIRIATIGRTTSDAARKAFLIVDIVASEPTTEALVSSIVKFYE